MKTIGQQRRKFWLVVHTLVGTFYHSARHHGLQVKANPPIDVPGSTPFQKMDNLLRAVIQVPKAEIDRREQQWKKQHGKKRRKKAAKG